jgi:hypothetical protein
MQVRLEMTIVQQECRTYCVLATFSKAQKDRELKIEVYIIDLKKETCNTANSTTTAASNMFEELL